MKRVILLGALAGLLALTSQAWADAKSTIQQLLAENKNLTAQLDKANKTNGEIAKAKLTIDGAVVALNHAKSALKVELSGLENEAGSHDQELLQHSQRTGCPVVEGEPEGTFESADKAFVAACNAAATKYNAWRRDIMKKGAGLAEFSQKLQEEQNKISNATEEWAKKQKKINSDLNKLAEARSEWQHRYNDFVFNSETYERLKKTAPAAQICKEQYLEKAVQCLEWLWDGAANR